MPASLFLIFVAAGLFFIVLILKRYAPESTGGLLRFLFTGMALLTAKTFFAEAGFGSGYTWVADFALTTGIVITLLLTLYKLSRLLERLI